MVKRIGLGSVGWGGYEVVKTRVCDGMYIWKDLTMFFRGGEAIGSTICSRCLSEGPLFLEGPRQTKDGAVNPPHPPTKEICAEKLEYRRYVYASPHDIDGRYVQDGSSGKWDLLEGF